MTRRRWRFRLALATTITALTTAAIAVTSTADTTIAPTSMTMNPSSAGGLVSDSSAGTVMKLWTNGAASVPVGATDAGATLKIKARADLCLGAPIMAVKRNGTTLATITVNSTTWQTYTVPLGAGSGQAPVTVEFTNDYMWWFFCDRNLYVGDVVVVGGGGTTPGTPITTTPLSTTAAPTTTLPATTPPTTTVPTTAVPTTAVPTTTVPTTAAPTTTVSPTTTTAPSSPCPVNQFQARYFNSTSTTGTPAVVQCENAPGGEFSGQPIAGVNADNFSVEYTGLINFPETTTYVVSATLGGVGARVWLDDALVIDKWAAQWSTTNVPRTVSKGLHKVSTVYFHQTGIAHFGISIPRAATSTASNNGNYFAADSFWNQPVPAGATVDPRSAGWVSTLDRSNNGIVMNSTDWSTTVYNAPAGTPTTQIYLSTAKQNITIPYLPSYRPTRDADSHLSVIDDATGCLYEFQNFDPTAKSAVGQTTYHAYTGSGGHTAGGGHSGGELSYLGGMITPQDVQAGVIDHALRYAIPINAPTFVYPGTRSDGTTAGGVPEGTRLQLDPSLDLTRFGLTPFQLMVARALQVYGGFNADGSGLFALYARSTVDGTTYSQPLQGLPDALIQHMRFLSPTISSTDLYLDRSDDPTCNQRQ